ncbi:FAD-binding oxidoreductase [Jiangella gansuensis]|uniref:FAD-binding oxidoreductase n=1 Tax=Jiangella gansuensis TaxID=281473 RepID=UPI0004AC9912|nr:FAD-binding oxidoreductase [Jiangella gansuensis]
MNHFDGFRATLAGQAFAPGDDGYEDVRRPWNLLIDQRPALVVLAGSVADVQATVRLATERGLPLAVQSSGHGAVHPCDDGVVLNVSRLTGVAVDADAQVASIDAGARWRAVLEAAAPHELAGLSGTAPTVGAVGYTLGGGLGLLLRRYGFAADSVLAADVVTADGTLVHASETENPELLWALKGGSGNFGVVTRLQVRLYHVPLVQTGMAVYPGDRAAEVLATWADWTGSVSDDVTSAAMVMSVPPLPSVPEPMRGQHVVMVRATIAGGDGAELDALRSALGTPLMDGFRTATYLEAALSGMEPTDPMPSTGDSALLDELSPAAVDTLLELTAPGSPVPGVEIRHLGGAAAKDPEQPSAVSHRDARYVAAANALAPTPEQLAVVRQRLADGFGALEPHTRPGRLVNFMPARSTPETVQAAFSPAAYQRLREVKRTYDPSNVFRFNHNIPPAP